MTSTLPDATQTVESKQEIHTEIGCGRCAAGTIDTISFQRDVPAGMMIFNSQTGVLREFKQGIVVPCAEGAPAGAEL